MKNVFDVKPDDLKKIFNLIGGYIKINGNNNRFRSKAIQWVMDVFTENDVEILSVEDKRTNIWYGKYTVENIKEKREGEKYIKALCTYDSCVDVLIKYEKDIFTCTLFIFDGEMCRGERKGCRVHIEYVISVEQLMTNEAMFTYIMDEYKCHLEEEYEKYLESEKLKWCMSKHIDLMK